MAVEKQRQSVRDERVRLQREEDALKKQSDDLALQRTQLELEVCVYLYVCVLKWVVCLVVRYIFGVRDLYLFCVVCKCLYVLFRDYIYSE